MSDKTTCEWCGREFEDYPPCKPYCSRKCEAEDPNSSFHLKWYEEKLAKENSPETQSERKREEEEKKASEEAYKLTRKRENEGCFCGCPIIPTALISLGIIFVETPKRGDVSFTDPEMIGLILGTLFLLGMGIHMVWLWKPWFLIFRK